MQHRFPRILLPSLVLLVAATLLLATSDAFADHDMPDVVGQSEARAVDQLEALGLRVHVVTIAGASPGRVAHQSPDPGSTIAEGDEVMVRTPSGERVYWVVGLRY